MGVKEIFAGEKPALQVSQDEQVYRQAIYQKEKIEPGQKAVDVLEQAIDIVLGTLGVDTKDSDTVAQQMTNLGIIMTENSDEATPQLNGFFVFRLKKIGKNFVDPIPTPYAWIGSARLNQEGAVFCDIQWFETERLNEVGGERIIK